ncbi:MAG: hypothetical protein ACTSRG_17505 [Candidatus Helarchaeota archaeon]
MTCTDFIVNTTSLECTYNLLNNNLSCSLIDNGVQKKAEGVSFLYIDSQLTYNSSMFYKNLSDPQKNEISFKYIFDRMVECRILGLENNKTINCKDVPRVL